MRIEKYIRLWYRGSFFSEPSDKLLPGVVFPSPDAVDVPEGVYAFQFREKHIRSGTLEDGESVEKSDWKDVGPTYYPGGIVKTRDEIPDTPRNHTLRSNMECNGWAKVVYCWPVITLPFDDAKDVVIADKRKLTREVWNRQHPEKQCIPGH